MKLVGPVTPKVLHRITPDQPDTLANDHYTKPKDCQIFVWTTLSPAQVQHGCSAVKERQVCFLHHVSLTLICNSNELFYVIIFNRK